MKSSELTHSRAVAALVVSDQWASGLEVCGILSRYYGESETCRNVNMKDMKSDIAKETVWLLKRADWNVWIEVEELETCLGKLKNSGRFEKICEGIREASRENLEESTRRIKANKIAKDGRRMARRTEAVQSTGKEGAWVSRGIKGCQQQSSDDPPPGADNSEAGIANKMKMVWNQISNRHYHG